MKQVVRVVELSVGYLEHSLLHSDSDNYAH